MTYGTGTLTRSATDTVTMVNVREVMWRIQTDLRALRVLHRKVTEQWEANMLHDLQLLIYRGFIDQIDLVFTDQLGRLQPGSVNYAITRAWQGGSTDDGGGLRYFDSSQMGFRLLATYTDAWVALSAEEKQAIQQNELVCSWGPAVMPVGSGHYEQNRTYASGALGAVRSVYRGY